MTHTNTQGFFAVLSEAPLFLKLTGKLCVRMRKLICLSNSFHKNLIRNAYAIHFSIQWNVNSAPLWQCGGDHGLIRRCWDLSNKNTETLCGYLSFLYKYWSNSYQSKCFSVWVGLVHKQPHSSGVKLGYHWTDVKFWWKRPRIWWVYVNANNITKDIRTEKCCHSISVRNNPRRGSHYTVLTHAEAKNHTKRNNPLQSGLFRLYHP